MTGPGGAGFVPADEREWAYDCASHIGTLDKALNLAAGSAWVVVDMKKDWNRVYP